MTENYVSQAAWLAPTGRSDALDVIADEFERADAPIAADQQHEVRQAA